MRRQGRYLDVDPGFGRRLAAARRARKLPQAELAKQVGATQRMVSNYERSHGRPRADLIGKMAKVLGVTVEDLLIPKEARKRVEKEKTFLLEKLRRSEDITPEERKTARILIEILLLKK